MEAPIRPIAALPSSAHCARQPASVRARLWTRGCVFGPQDDAPRQWLHLRDGRVLAFRLPAATLGDDGLIAPLAQRVADDLSGQCSAVEHPAWGYAQATLEQARRDLAMARLKTQRVHVGLDERSERQLRAALACQSLEPPAPDVLFSTHLAGFQYHAGPHLETRLSAGLRLDLVREPNNAHDPLAVRAEWQGHRLGYVPRPENADIAQRLVAGEKLSARIVGLHVERESLQRVEVAIDIVRD